MLDPTPSPTLRGAGGGHRRWAGAASAALLAILAPTTAAAAAPTASATSAATAEEESPLTVSIDTLTPSTLPERGRVVVTGSVTNTSEDVWDAVRVFPLTSVEPLRTRAALTLAAASDPLVPIGDRLVADGLYDELGSLAPGESASYLLRVPVSELQISGRQGVYWWGVHALGQVGEARDLEADGRARTFLPLVDPTTRAARERPVQPVSILISIRRGQAHRADGRLKGLRAWSRDLEPGGRLHELLELASAAGVRPITLLVDPAVPAAVSALARDNPPRDLGPTTPGDGASPEEGQATQPADPDASTTDPAPDPGSVGSLGSGPAPWLSRFAEVAGRHQVLELPYGDIDVATVLAQDPDLYARSRRYSQSLTRVGATPRPAIAPPDGYVDPAGLTSVEPDTTVIVSDRVLPRSTPPVVTVGGRRLLATSSASVAGGPGPDDRFADVALRQRILSEAAVRWLRGEAQPMVVPLPGDWAPTSGLRFFTGFDRLGWLRLTTLTEAAAAPAQAVDATDLRVLEEVTAIPSVNVLAARELVRTGTQVERVLTDNDRIDAEVAGVALTTTSYAAAVRPFAARRTAVRTRAWLEQRLGQVRIEAPSSVTLSNERGGFSVTVVNELGEPVTLGLEARSSSDDLTIRTPETFRLGPDERRSLDLAATTTELGVHSVSLSLTDGDGNPVGSTTSVPVRALQVGDVIWVILGTGLALLFVAIVLRLTRRIMAARRR